MPKEYVLLKHKGSPISSCPKCGASPFIPFMRGQVQNSLRAFFGRPYCCLICSKCKEIVGYEQPKPYRCLIRKGRYAQNQNY